MKIDKEQEVKIFSDKEDFGKQEVHIDSDDDLETWVIINHCGEEISLSLKNWNNLVELVESAKAEIDVKEEEK